MSKVVAELITLENGSAIGGGASRQSGDGAIDGIRGDIVEYTTRKVGDAEDVPEVGGCPRCVTTDPLTSATSSDARAFEDGSQLREVALRPEDVVVSEDGKRGGDLIQGREELGPLVQLSNSKNLDVLERVSITERAGHRDICIPSHDEDFLGTLALNALNALGEFFGSLEGGGDDNRDFLRGESRRRCNREGLNSQVSPNTHEEASVADEDGEHEHENRQQAGHRRRRATGRRGVAANRGHVRTSVEGGHLVGLLSGSVVFLCFCGVFGRNSKNSTGEFLDEDCCRLSALLEGCCCVPEKPD